MRQVHSSVFIFLPVLLFTVVALAACGLAAPTPLPTPEPITLRFAARAGVADYAPLAEEFHRQHPHITVQLITLTYGTQFGGGLQNLKTLNVDVVRDTAPYPPDARLKNELLPLDDRIDADKAFPQTDMYAGVMAALRIEGTQYGIPAGLNPVVAYYDNLRYKIAKVSPPTANWTLTDFLESALAVNKQETKDVNNVEFGYGFCTDPGGADPIVFTYLFGGQLVDNLANPTRPTLDAPANVAALQWYASLHSAHGVTPDPNELSRLFRGGVAEAAMRGKCGLWIGFYADVSSRAPTRRWLGEPTMLPLPRGQTSLSAATVDGYYILRQSRHPDAAWMWISFLVHRQEAAGIMVPPRMSHVRSDAFARRVAPDALQVARSLPNNVILMGGGIAQGIEPIAAAYVEAVKQVMQGTMDAKNALAAAQARALVLFSSR